MKQQQENFNQEIINDEQYYNNDYNNNQIVQTNDNQYYYDQYYGGTSMQYNADQIDKYEQAYDQNYAQEYYNYYSNYLNNSNNDYSSDLLRHQQEYKYYLDNYEYMKENFPKKIKIIRWEEIDQNYNSLEQTNQYIEMLEQFQLNNEENN